MKNNVKNTDFQGKNRVFVGIVSRLQYYTSCYIMNRTGYLSRPLQILRTSGDIKLVFLDHPHHFLEFSPFFQICSIKRRKIDHFRIFEKSDGVGPKIPV